MYLYQDWKEIKWDKTGEKPKDMSNKTYINNEMRKGNTISVLKKSNNIINIKKIENETEIFKHKLVEKDIGKKIAKIRCEKKITQKELANNIYLTEKIIKDIECGKSIYNPEIINKIEKFFKQKIRN